MIGLARDCERLEVLKRDLAQVEQRLTALPLVGLSKALWKDVIRKAFALHSSIDLLVHVIGVVS